MGCPQCQGMLSIAFQFWLFAGSLQFTALANIGTQHCLQSTARPNMESQQCDCWDSQCSPIMDELAPHTALSYNVVWVPVCVTGWPVLRWGPGPDHSTLCEKMTARWINAWAWNPPDQVIGVPHTVTQNDHALNNSAQLLPIKLQVMTLNKVKKQTVWKRYNTCVSCNNLCLWDENEVI